MRVLSYSRMQTFISTFGLFQIQLAKAEVACCFSSVSVVSLSSAKH